MIIACCSTAAELCQFLETALRQREKIMHVPGDPQEVEAMLGKPVPQPGSRSFLSVFRGGRQ